MSGEIDRLSILHARSIVKIIIMAKYNSSNHNNSLIHRSFPMSLDNGRGKWSWMNQEYGSMLGSRQSMLSYNLTYSRNSSKNLWYFHVQSCETDTVRWQPWAHFRLTTTLTPSLDGLKRQNTDSRLFAKTSIIMQTGDVRDPQRSGRPQSPWFITSLSFFILCFRFSCSGCEVSLPTSVRTDMQIPNWSESWATLGLTAYGDRRLCCHHGKRWITQRSEIFFIFFIKGTSLLNTCLVREGRPFTKWWQRLKTTTATNF